MKMKKKIGFLLLGLGILCLVGSLVLAFTKGSYWVAILFWLSIFINTAGVVLIRSGKKEGYR